MNKKITDQEIRDAKNTFCNMAEEISMLDWEVSNLRFILYRIINNNHSVSLTDKEVEICKKAKILYNNDKVTFFMGGID